MIAIRLAAISASIAWLVLLPAARAFEAAGPAVVSDIDGHVSLGNDRIASGEYVHQDGPLADHPWYTIDVTPGEKLRIRLFTNFLSTFWLYRVVDGQAEPGDSPFVEMAEILLLQQADYPNSTWPRIMELPVEGGGQLLVQVDATAGVGGRYGLQIERTLPSVPEPSGVIVAGVALALAAVSRRLMARRLWVVWPSEARAGAFALSR